MCTCKHYIWYLNVIPAASLCIIVDRGLTDVNFDLLSLCLVTFYVRILLVFAILIIKGLPLSSRFDFYSLGLNIAFAVDIFHPILQVAIILCSPEKVSSSKGAWRGAVLSTWVA